MRKEFTAISAFSTLIAFTAGAVLCMQIANLKLTVDWAISPPVLWAFEAAIFGLCVYLWRHGVSFIGWLLGIAGIFVVRIAVTSSAGLGLALMRENPNMESMLQETTSIVPRLCAALFALMVCYPLRVMLPVRQLELGGQRRQFGDSAAARLARGEEGDRGLLIVTVKDRAAGGAGESRAKSEVRAPHLGMTSSAMMMEGDIALPLSTILSLLPDHLVTNQALAFSDSQAVTIPLSIIHTQLKEAQIVFSVADLRTWLPPLVKKAIVQPSESDIEMENGLVSLPLELIVSQLPPDALQLPAPSPPSWAELQESERVVFARI